jgi:hypothetical protein
MRRASLPIVTFMLASVFMSAQSPTPFKLGTFDNAGRTFVGIVLRESVVIIADGEAIRSRFPCQVKLLRLRSI